MNERDNLKREFEDLLGSPAILGFLDQNVVDGFWYRNLENPGEEWMSDGFWRALGFEAGPSGHAGSLWREMIFPEDARRVQDNIKRHCANPAVPFDQRVRYHTADDRTITVRCRGLAIRDEQGRAIRMLGIHTIVHDSDRQELTDQLNELLEMSSDAIIAWSVEEGVQRWNYGATRMYGFTVEEAMGKDVCTLLQTSLPVSWEEVQYLLEHGTEWSGEVYRKRKDGQRIVTSTRYQRVLYRKNRSLILQVDRDITRQKAAQEQRELLLNELNHRVKNSLATVQAVAALTLEHTPEPKKFTELFTGRLQAISSIHELLTRERVARVSLYDLVKQQLFAYAGTNFERVRLEGEDIVIGPSCAHALGLIFHELAINALKYGALRESKGLVKVSWKMLEKEEGEGRGEGQETDNILIVWAEQGGPPVIKPAHQGFGTQLIEQSLSYNLDGESKIYYNETGVIVELIVPRELCND